MRIYRRRTFEGKQPDDRVYAGLGYEIVELEKFTGVGKPLPEIGDYNYKSSLVAEHMEPLSFILN